MLQGPLDDAITISPLDAPFIVEDVGDNDAPSSTLVRLSQGALLPHPPAGLGLPRPTPDSWPQETHRRSYNRTVDRRRVGAILKIATVLFGAVVLCSCSVSVVAGNFNPVQELKYDAKWNTGWTQIARDGSPLKASATSPGVCNSGGSQQGCFDADENLIADDKTLANALSGSIVPSEFAGANATLHQGLSQDEKGLSERDLLISTQNASGTFARSNATLQDAASLFMRSVGQFQGPNRPTNPFS